MRLSEAIRLGAMLKPQVRGSLFALTAAGDLGSCALGAAEDAIRDVPTGLFHGNDEIALVYVVYAALLGRRSMNPVRKRRQKVFRIIEELNDRHGWTREQIADWVETREAVMRRAGLKESHATPEPVRSVSEPVQLASSR